jgi:hypothetical protein
MGMITKAYRPVQSVNHAPATAPAIPRRRLDFSGVAGYLPRRLSQRLSNPYEVLDVARDATAQQIQRAYRELARRYHPDVNPSRDARARFQQVSDAYEVLHDPVRRARYDRLIPSAPAREREQRVRTPRFTTQRPQRDVPRFLDEEPLTVLYERPRRRSSMLGLGFSVRVTVAWRRW